ncbi:hypothetical protein NIES1031_08415 [Chroogloeocystis siderophila 5.2 s.c.1]|uniref:Uncharacterized protein n=2 Tax=Chroogloeocystis TaxID=329162 RepID=A0A1U7HUP3_9CHRO|nr:hypothetical protein [Chroogloeocystis siderophila]OKH27323.1 hypothetical protein NIES1031_08415 [Chroogloeocystis siderophila 5.2 s.c.1]
MVSKFIITLAALFSFASINNRVENKEYQSLISHSPSSHNHADNHDKIMEIPSGQAVPTVDLVVHKDAMKGYNLEVKVTNFQFAPERVNTDATPGEGHGHIYINNKKLTRLYGSWYYLENLQPGRNEITVSLNANNHMALAHNGKRIFDTEVVNVPGVTQSQK